MEPGRELLESFYQSRSIADAMGVAEELCHRGFQVRGQVLSSGISIEKLAERLKDDYGQRRGCSVRLGEPCLVQMPLVGNGHKGDGEGAKVLLWEKRDSGIITILSSQGRDEFDLLRSALTRYLLPEVYVVYLKTREIKQALDNIVKRNGEISLRVREYVARSLIDDKKSTKKVRSKREWTDEEYSIIFEHLAEKKQWLSAIQLEVHGNKTTSGRIWRDSSFSCNEEFEYFMGTLVKALQQAVVKSRKFFERRGSAENSDTRSRPLKVTYRDEIFADKQQNYRLIQVLKGLANAELAVFHPNPYLHASLLDYSDGSGYEIWVTTTSSILIIPKRKATAQSIERLCEHICDNFEEGELLESVQ